MKALVFAPPSTAAVRDVPVLDEPGAVEVAAVAVGVCGTDREIVHGELGETPPGDDYLILGHESLGRVVADPSGTFEPGDLVVAVVREPDPVPCPNCAAGEWDMCRNGRWTEHGIKGAHGYARERYRLDPARAVRLDPRLAPVGVLLETASILAKAWEHVERIGARALFSPGRVLVTGAGPVGLLAALMGVQRGLDVHVLDRVTTGPKPALVADLGATYHPTTPDLDTDIVLECTGVAQVVADALGTLGPNGIACLTGMSHLGQPLQIDGSAANRAAVLGNRTVFGSINANLRHYRLAADALAAADPAWLERMITRRVPLDSAADALRVEDGDVKVVIQIGG